jgi:uncharacterized protein (TIGR02452 family)
MASIPTSTPKLNKQGRAKLARDTLNNVIPHILKSNKRAQDGVNASELIRYSPFLDSQKATSAPEPSSTPASTDEPPVPPKVKVTVIQSDTYDAVQTLIQSTKPGTKIAALNMASALHPGGGVLNGALAQEESLCVRSTLYPSLKDNFYRIPSTAAIYTPDVLVFRSASHADLPKAEWFYTDIISVAAPKHPDTVMGPDEKLVYEVEQDKETMVLKVRLIFQVARQKGIKHLVLGALGCGAYRNPPEEVAKIFRKAIFGDGRKRGPVEGVEEVVFAIFDDGENLRTFRDVFKEEIKP